MPVDLVKGTYGGAINTLTLGKAPTVTIGGQTTLPFLVDEGVLPHAPVIAAEILDCVPADWPDALQQALGTAMHDPIAWARASAAIPGVRMLCVRVQSVHPDWGAAPHEKAVATVRAIADAVSMPLVIIGCGDDDIDNEVLAKISQALKGTQQLFGIATQTNYKTLAATCLADGHAIIAESPIDVNIAKQLNILISDMGLDPVKIVMHPTTASLGYGMEYVYSIMERARLAAFIGDKMLAMPFIVFPGQETWKVKEAKEAGAVQGVYWEIATSAALIQAGADIIVMRHSEAMRAISEHIALLQKR